MPRLLPSRSIMIGRSSLSGLADTSLAPEIQAIPISPVSVELAFDLPLHALATSFLANFSDNPMRLLVLVAFLRRLAAPFLDLILANSRSLALLAPVRQTVSPAAVLTELALFFGLPAFWTLLHFGDPPYLVITIIDGFSAPLYLKPHLPLSTPIPGAVVLVFLRNRRENCFIRKMSR